MRLFTAVYPAPEIIEAISERIPPGFRHATSTRWHITLSFHPDCNSLRLEDLEAELAILALESRPMDLRLAGTGRFGPISWLGVAGDVQALCELAAGARRAARVAKVATDGKDYVPHLTLGRDDGALADAMWGWESELWRVEELRLMRSRIEGRTRHEVIATFPLHD